MKKILCRIKYDWDVLTNKSEILILKKYAEISRLCTIIIAIWFYLYITFLIFPSFLTVFQYVFGIISETELLLPIHADYFLKNLMIYFTTLTLEYIIILIACTVGIANYSMFIAVIQHACALFSIVQWRVKQRFEKRSHNSYYVNVESELLKEKEWIVTVIEFYKHAIEFVDLLKSFYELIHLFEELLWFIFILVDYFYLFQIFTWTLNWTDIISKLLYIIGSLFVIFVYSYLSQQLIDHNVNVSIIFCEIPFYSLSLKTQKLLPLLIMKSMRQCSLSLTSAIVVSHDLLATSIKKSFSFAAVLFNLQ
ncbi:uncharacterized protein LOC124957379 [Vespa velutina]|uniref:uncharacterized protein LOC124957379 n=1 Tax=Vespa velutina TaxID=202808 RepID=UPI001FB50980|nr:uncharacterized protein LOC124957379 [Vespa velutina]